ELRPVHPRTAIGYYEPGHYCFVVVDGRQWGHSDGAEIADLARLMESLGCTLAYNLDGGASSMMIFHGKTVDKPSNGGRYINDMLIITEPADGAEEGGR
ncbi:MAG: phosphodiester glycosidase family protein, partial [Oscillospiraceae bacterium]|nr:phosphodiester glycosidase family protein [Oscillospiraceae bacterium]